MSGGRYTLLFDAYTRRGGSVTHTTRELFLYKNTAQKLWNALAKRTCYNPRDFNDHAVLIQIGRASCRERV